MSDLTEKWKSGKLKEGAYYVRNEQGVIFTAENYVNYDCFNDTKIYDFYNVETDIKEILAPVPSYEEWYKFNQLLGKCYRFLRLTETKVEAIEKVKRGLVKELDEVLK